MKVLEHIGEGNIKQRQGTQHQLSGVVLLQYTTTEMVSLLHLNIFFYLLRINNETEENMY